MDTEMLLIYRAGICGALVHRKGTRHGSDIARTWTSEAHHQEQDNTFHKKRWVHTSQDTSSVPTLNPGKPEFHIHGQGNRNLTDRHDILWYGIPLWTVRVSCPSCAPSQLPLPSPSLPTGGTS